MAKLVYDTTTNEGRFADVFLNGIASPEVINEIKRIVESYDTDEVSIRFYERLDPKSVPIRIRNVYPLSKGYTISGVPANAPEIGPRGQLEYYVSVVFE